MGEHIDENNLDWFDGSMLIGYQLWNVLMDNYFETNIIMMDCDFEKFLYSNTGFDSELSGWIQ